MKSEKARGFRAFPEIVAAQAAKPSATAIHLTPLNSVSACAWEPALALFVPIFTRHVFPA